MKKRLRILLLILGFILLNSYVCAQVQEEARGKINISLKFPQRYNAPMKAKPIIKKPVEISGGIFIGISKRPTKNEVNSERYLVEYFMDDTLIFSTKGEIADNSELPNYDFLLDSAQFKNGPHRLIVNFWDKDGPSAIGMRDIVINNAPQGE